MARKTLSPNDVDQNVAIQLSNQISELVVHLYKKRGFTQQRFAAAIGYTRPGFNQMIHSKDASRLWRLPAICAAARVLGADPVELISAARQWKPEPDLRVKSLCLLTLGTDQGSDERFSIVVKDAAESLAAHGDLDKDCSAEYAAIGAPRTLEAYRSLRMSDEELFQLTQDAIADHPKLPVWAALGKYEQEDSDPVFQ